jgi:nickel transport protein
MREKWFWRKQSRPNLWVQGVFLILIICAFTTPAAAAPAVIPAAATPAPIATETKATTVDRQMLEEAVNKALERQLAPVKEMLTELTIHQTSLTDIIGGIGYILGLFGLWAYFLSKRKKNS